MFVFLDDDQNTGKEKRRTVNDGIGENVREFLVFGGCCHVTFRDNDEVRMSRYVTLRMYKDPLGIPPGV